MGRIVKGPQPKIENNRILKVRDDALIYISIIDLVQTLYSNDSYKKNY